MHVVLRTIALLAIWPLAHAVNADVFYGKAGTGRVVDAASGQPLEGVDVEALWQVTNFRDPAGAPLAELTHANAQTNASGEFTFPAWGPLSIDLDSHVRSVVKVIDRSQPHIRLWKSGYRSNVEKGPAEDTRPFWRRFRIGNDDVRDAWWDQRTFVLEPN